MEFCSFTATDTIEKTPENKRERDWFTICSLCNEITQCSKIKIKVVNKIDDKNNTIILRQA